MARTSTPVLPGSAPHAWDPKFNRYVELWHGTLRKHATNMKTPPDYVRFDLGAPDVDFGRGFYTTTLRDQARQWAWIQHFALPVGQRGAIGNQPVAIWFRLELAALADLDGLAFAIA